MHKISQNSGDVTVLSIDPYVQRLLWNVVTQCRQIPGSNYGKEARIQNSWGEKAGRNNREGTTQRLWANPREGATDVRGVLSLHARCYTATAPCLYAPDLYSSRM
jgi:hypothetical protein